MNSPNAPFVIPDVQNFEDLREIAIDSVGIKSIRHPVRILGRDGTAQHSIASFNMYVALSQHVKGTHMSRFVELLGAGPREFSIETLGALLIEMTDRLDASSGHIDFSFPYFISKYAPVSAIESLLDYEATFIGDIRQGATSTSLRVLVPVTSLCPCSKTISERGAHNQRSHITVTAQLRETVWIEDLVALVEREASCELYGLLKRADEKYVTERAYDNPKFVEDLVRDVAARLESDPRIGDYTVESENFESIHNHSAYARIDGRKRPVE